MRERKESKLIYLFSLLCLGASYVTGKSTGDSKVKVDCVSPYHPVGNVCMFIDNRIEGTWNQMRSLCMEMGGDLAHFTDANHLHDVYNYIYQYNLNDSSFWVGADDLLEEDKWQWSNMNGAVRMNTPLWGPGPAKQEPTGGSQDNCGMLNMEKYYYLYDDSCDALHGVICRPREFEETPFNDNEKRRKEKENEIRAECPLPFEPIGGSCLLVNEAGANTWTTARDLCESLGGHLAKVDDANVLGLLYDLFQNKSTTTDMWIGGTDRFTEGNWHWLDSSLVKMGTPFWGMDLVGAQEPIDDTAENCITLRETNYFFFHSQPCSEEAGSVCQYDLPLRDD